MEISALLYIEDEESRDNDPMSLNPAERGAYLKGVADANAKK